MAASTKTSKASTTGDGVDAGAAEASTTHTDDVDPGHDVVAVPSLNKNGAPDQEPGFEVLVDDRAAERRDKPAEETTSSRSSGAGTNDTETR